MIGKDGQPKPIAENDNPTDLSRVLSNYFDMEFHRGMAGLYRSEAIKTVQTDEDVTRLRNVFEQYIIAMRKIPNGVFQANHFSLVVDKNNGVRIQFDAHDLEENSNIPLFGLRNDQVKPYADELANFKSAIEYGNQ